ncbi:Ubiquinone/menaquinone biosynthesis C-methylase UbiE [Thermomonospora echinospora]|uniref:Ubiquinone/menaquinone biosynthesis C-methylase UbiE n=1 Tax=Thermomonospora echinospora TaxID=1992 RepID=A0A1H6ECL0_9ACTN|nr:methyltransferase domain-containing protein [Thermomonospora echinospora]SEG94535.1 Ubiquinone/menaquinone biosynthesis C-methylase UbiE [Thermomonospora echinospora]
MSNEAIKALIPQLDAVDDSPGAAELRARSYELLHAAPGALVIDAGCGAGRAVAELADQGVRVMGIDVNDQMIALARERWPYGEFRVGDVYALPLGDGEVAGYRADKVIHTLADPGQALAEARRVLASGGRIVLCGQDWDTLVIDSTDPELTRTIVRKRADQVASPRAARRYRNLLLDAGFRDVTVEVHTGVFTDDSFLPVLTRLAEFCCEHGAITRAQADTWIADQRERARADRLFAAVPIFMAAATNP